MRTLRYIMSFSLLIVFLTMPWISLAQDDTEMVPDPVGLRGDAPPYALHGPYWIGARDNIEIENGDRPLMGTIWYPASNPDGADYSEMPYSSQAEDLVGPEWNYLYGRALAEALPDTTNAPYPLIVFSHGWSVSRSTNAYLAEHLASYGFVVLAINHPGGTFRDQVMLGFDSPELAANIPDGYVLWVQDDLRVIDYARELTTGSGDFAGMIDMDRIGAAGYSSGGHTALQLAGAEYNFDELAAACEADPDLPEACPLLPVASDLIALAGVDATPDEAWSVVDEPVVDAVLGLAPGSLSPFGEAGLAAVDVPTLFISGTLDRLVPTPLTETAYAALSSSQKSMVWLENANHFVFMDCGWQTDDFIWFCADRVWDMDRAHDLVNHFATALFLSVLYGDVDASAALSAEAVQMPGIIYEVQGY